jgi:hypothetical protein
MHHVHNNSKKFAINLVWKSRSPGQTDQAHRVNAVTDAKSPQKVTLGQVTVLVSDLQCLVTAPTSPHRCRAVPNTRHMHDAQSERSRRLNMLSHYSRSPRPPQKKKHNVTCCTQANKRQAQTYCSRRLQLQLVLLQRLRAVRRCAHPYAL